MKLLLVDWLLDPRRRLRTLLYRLRHSHSWVYVASERRHVCARPGCGAWTDTPLPLPTAEVWPCQPTLQQRDRSGNPITWH